LKGILKVAETTFLWWYAADSITPLCNNRVKKEKDNGTIKTAHFRMPWFPLIMNDHPTPGINKKHVFHHPYSSWSIRSEKGSTLAIPISLRIGSLREKDKLKILSKSVINLFP